MLLIYSRFDEVAIFIFRKMKKTVADKEIEKEYKERHWTKKPLEEMTTRDYRIFREDFLITCKGEL